MSINGITSQPSAAGFDLAGSAIDPAMQSLGQEEFFKLLTVELSSQDPLEPKKDSEFISQIMQISALEQSKAMQQDLEAMRIENRMLQANAMLGHQVDLGDAVDGGSGEVSAVKMENGRPMIEVGGRLYDLSQLMAISLPFAAQQQIQLETEGLTGEDDA